jgi:hypothetical protein
MECGSIAGYQIYPFSGPLRVFIMHCHRPLDTINDPVGPGPGPLFPRMDRRSAEEGKVPIKEGSHKSNINKLKIGDFEP